MTPQWPDPLAPSIWRVVDGRGPTRRMVGQAKARVVCSIYAREASDEITLSFPQSYPLSLISGFGSSVILMRQNEGTKCCESCQRTWCCILSTSIRRGPPHQPSGIHDEKCCQNFLSLHLKNLILGANMYLIHIVLCLCHICIPYYISMKVCILELKHIKFDLLYCMPFKLLDLDILS